MLRTLLVEDEPLSRMYLSSLLAEAAPDAEIVACVATEEEALNALLNLKPDLLFLDIELQTGTGFGVVGRMEDAGAYTVFTTAMDQHAINLLYVSGMPCIQKPIDLESLEHVVAQAREPDGRERQGEALRHLRASLQNGGVPLSMLVGSAGAPRYVSLDTIVAIDAAGPVSRIRLANGCLMETDLTLKTLEELLGAFGFFRVHIGHLVNLRKVMQPPAAGEASISMLGGLAIPLSPKRFEALLHQLEQLNR